MLRLFLLAILLGSVSAVYDEDVVYDEDYDDAWQTISEYRKKKHNFVVHEDVQPTELVEEETYLARLKREAEETEESYDDSWMNNKLEDASEELRYDPERSQVSLAVRQEAETGGSIDDPVVDVKYNIGKELEVGDVIEIQGTYSSHTGWFSANILDKSGNILLHVNPRPNYKVTVMNSNDGSWETEVICELPALENGKEFVMRIILMDESYKIYFNGRPLSKTFPYRQSISSATNIVLMGGTNDFTWDKIVLPGEEKQHESETEGRIENPAQDVKYSIGKELEAGDVIEIQGTYSFHTGWFSANILDKSGNILLHVNPRPNHRQTVMNSRTGRWETEVICELPWFRNKREFVMRIVLMDESYKIYFDGRPLSKTFPYRRSISLATDIVLMGGTNDFSWNGIILPREEKAKEYKNSKEFKSRVDDLTENILEKVKGKNVQEIKSYANSSEGSVAVFKWWVMKKLQSKEEILTFEDETLDLILSNREVLEMFMTSGDVQSDRYKDALMILGNLINKDPQIKEEPLRLRLAVATALTHSTPVYSMAVGRKFDPLSVYQEYVRLSQENGTLYPPFFESTAWHLRYVVGTWQTEDEHIWARENTPEGYDNPAKIGDATHRMMTYKLKNDDGFSVFHRASYYYYLPLTLEAMHRVGGVCGAISKVAAGMCHSYGVPATPVGQPGHCAYIWMRNGRWVLGNDVSGWGTSNTHSGIQYTWMKPAYYFRLMNDAQKNLESYRLSEKMRIVSKLADPQDRFPILEDASTECPYNFAVWMDLETAMEQPSLQKEKVQDILLPTLLAQREREKTISDIAEDKKVTSECFGETAFRINDDQGGTAYCKNETGDFELDLVRPSTIKELKFHWWGRSKPAEYDIYAMSKEGTYVLVRTHKDEKVVGTFNHWSYLEGWEMKTTKIKVDMRKGMLDYWGKNVYFGIRTLNVLGLPHDVLEDVSTGKPVTADKYSTDPASLVDADNSTFWIGFGSNSSWFEIDLKKICALDSIEMIWDGEERPENVKVTYKTGSGMETEAPTKEPFNKVSLDMDSGSKLIVEIEGSGPGTALKGVTACGVAYSGKDIIKLKIGHALDDHFFVKRDLIKAIDSMEYED